MAARAFLDCFLHRTAPQVELPRKGMALLDVFIHAGDKQFYGGTDYAAGAVKINGAFKRAYVRLYDNETGALLAQQWTSTAGLFRFDNISASRRHFVVAFDPVSGEKADVFDRI